MPESRVYQTSDCDRGKIKGKRITVVGYGSQGRAFALNLRDCGMDVRVALRDSSPSLAEAKADGIEVSSLAQAADADIIILAIPDHEHTLFYDDCLKEKSSHKQIIVFLSGANVYYDNIDFDSRHDVILIAPHGPGSDLREKYLSGAGLSCFLAITPNASEKAKEIGLAIADAIGCSQAGIYETTFRDEAIGDLFGEQALLVGGLAGMTMAVFDKLVDRGLKPEHAYLETVAQLKLLASMIEKYGPAGMMARVSKTALSGSLMAMLLLFNEDFDQRLDKIYEFVASGEFNKFLQNEACNGFVKTREMLKLLHDDPCQQAAETFDRTGD